MWGDTSLMGHTWQEETPGFGHRAARRVDPSGRKPHTFFYLFSSTFRSETQRDTWISSKSLPAAAQCSQCSQHPGPDQRLG